MAGYYIAPHDKFASLSELMNMDDQPQEGYVTITYEYIPSVPAGFGTVKALWLDIGGCMHGSEMPVKSMTHPFTYTSKPWTSDINGRLIGIGGHLHDGGTHIKVMMNNKLECDCRAAYGKTPAYIGGGMPMSMSSMAGMSMSKRNTAAMPNTMSMDMGSRTMYTSRISQVVAMWAQSLLATSGPSKRSTIR